MNTVNTPILTLGPSVTDDTGDGTEWGRPSGGQGLRVSGPKLPRSK